MMKKMKLLAKNNTTYKVGLLQTKAYRILHQNTTLYLNELEIGPVRWALLGLLCEFEEGIKPSDAADILGVEAPYVTNMTSDLTKRRLIKITPHKVDTRAKLIVLTPKGREFVKTTEVFLREKMKVHLRGVTPDELAGYLSVLTKTIDNFESEEK